MGAGALLLLLPLFCTLALLLRCARVLGGKWCVEEGREPRHAPALAGACPHES